MASTKVLSLKNAKTTLTQSAYQEAISQKYWGVIYQ